MHTIIALAVSIAAALVGTYVVAYIEGRAD